MTFRNQPLDVRISDGAVGGPEFITIVAETDGGDESRDYLRSKALGRWDVSYAARRESQWRPLQGFFLVMGGRRDTWPFRDRLDYTCSVAESVLTTIDSTHRQMWKRYTVGALTYDKKIVLPKNGTLTITGTGSYTTEYTTGIITIVSGAAPTAFVCEFYKLCRFDTDSMKARQITHKSDGTALVDWAGIPIKEVPLTSA